MGVYIRGMEMPKSCAECPVNMNICKRGYKYLLAHMELYDQRADDCPITTVPPHGRLIDAEEFLKNAQLQRCFRGDYALLLNDVIEECATVIEAEEGE